MVLMNGAAMYEVVTHTTLWLLGKGLSVAHTTLPCYPIINVSYKIRSLSYHVIYLNSI